MASVNLPKYVSLSGEFLANRMKMLCQRPTKRHKSIRKAKGRASFFRKMQTQARKCKHFLARVARHIVEIAFLCKHKCNLYCMALHFAQKVDPAEVYSRQAVFVTIFRKERRNKLHKQDSQIVSPSFVYINPVSWQNLLSSCPNSFI